MRFDDDASLSSGVAVAGIPLNIAIAGAESPAATGGVERFSPAMDELVPVGAVIERLTDNVFQWSEGPVWVPDGGFVLFSDDVLEAWRRAIG